MEAIGLITQQVRACEAAGVEFLCCPEAVLGGLADYASRPSEIAIGVRDGQLQQRLAPMASDTVTTVLGFTEIGDDGQLFNSAAVVHRGIVIGLYRKINPAINRSVYTPGRDTPVFRVGGLTFGVLICRDSTFRELADVMADGGATLLFVPTNNGLPATKGGPEVVEQARQTDIARAKENGVSVVRADVTGQADGLVSYGSSGIVNHHGTVLQVAKQFEGGLVVAEVEPEDLQRAATSSGNVSRTCRHFGISRKTFYKWKRRYGEHGEAALSDRPRRPESSPRATPKEVVSKILYLRQYYHFGPGNIAD